MNSAEHILARNYPNGLLNHVIDERNVVIKKNIAPTMQNKLVSFGFSPQAASQIFNNLFEEALEEIRKDGTIFRANYGDMLLKLEARGDQEAHKFLMFRREVGVCDDDIRRWWNIDEIARRLIVKISDLEIAKEFKKEIVEGKSEADAMDEVSKVYPLFLAPEDQQCPPSSLGAFLPPELRFKVEDYLERRKKDVDFDSDIEKYPSMNALIRDEIRKGNLATYVISKDDSHEKLTTPVKQRKKKKFYFNPHGLVDGIEKDLSAQIERAALDGFEIQQMDKTRAILIKKWKKNIDWGAVLLIPFYAVATLPFSSDEELWLNTSKPSDADWTK